MNESVDFVDGFLKKLRDCKTNPEFIASFDVNGGKPSKPSTSSSSHSSGGGNRRTTRPTAASMPIT
ncbi:hypothetical protein JCM16418_4676 [Paenibacillus pini JCM 16418]|uniref:Uncharacterized protein n=1 Tax=Paenibacillus pini JCM 16418 TaxID=1236976 RepID=W7Z7T1_9BACL|nr:hypothetical protein JCM16418_4676 [Paenibacillus pini JCM 16418]